ncbi:MAG: 4-hydroxythreonine-4-phosphate dehydrogenase PdxA [Desulfobacterales bacterium]|nr:4-hydroxythreonine-4-phosphate dehydrogenase PdxA [Desulfobacterales bacterium]
MSNNRKPRIALVMGDPCGIGPELVVKLMGEESVREMADIVIVADRRVYDNGVKAAGAKVLCQDVKETSIETLQASHLQLLDTPRFEVDDYTIGVVSEAAGRYQLACLARALDLCHQGITDGICFAPLNKEAMHLAGLKHEDESGFFREHLGHEGEFGLLNTLGNLWTSRATSHVSHRQVSELLTKESVVQAIRLLDSTLRTSGNTNPRIAAAGLNPHAGDGGMFGDEEIEVIAPAVAQAQQEGINVKGPFPPDTIFLMGRDGKYDAIVTMYHDQGQIAMKLMGFDHGVTVHAGLPYPVTTSAHGSAFNIAGQGIANVNALKAAFLLSCSMTGL